MTQNSENDTSCVTEVVIIIIIDDELNLLSREKLSDEFIKEQKILTGLMISLINLDPQNHLIMLNSLASTLYNQIIERFFVPMTNQLI